MYSFLLCLSVCPVEQIASTVLMREMEKIKNKNMLPDSVKKKITDELVKILKVTLELI